MYNLCFFLPDSARNRRNLTTFASLQRKAHNSSDDSLERRSVNSDEMNNLAPEAMRTSSSRLQAPSYRNGGGGGIPRSTTPTLVPPQVELE